MFSFKFDSIALDQDQDPNWTKILDPDPNSMYLDPQHCCTFIKNLGRYVLCSILVRIWVLCPDPDRTYLSAGQLWSVALNKLGPQIFRHCGHISQGSHILNRCYIITAYLDKRCGDSLVARQTTKAAVPGLKPASSTMI